MSDASWVRIFTLRALINPGGIYQSFLNIIIIANKNDAAQYLRKL